MKLLVFVCALLAAEASKLPGYTYDSPQGNSGHRNSGSPDLGATTGSLSLQQHSPSVGVPLPTGQFQSVGSNQQTSGPAPSSFAAQSGQYSGQSFSSSGQQSVSSQSTQVSSVGSSQSSFNTQFSGPAVQANTSPVQQFQPTNTQFSGPAVQANTSPVQQFQPTNTQEAFDRDYSVSSGTDGSDEACPENQVRHYDGTCVTPEVTRNVFVYASPKVDRFANIDPSEIPTPKVEHNIVFIRTDNLNSANDPIIIPPPQKKHVIYVLNKNSGFGGQRVIEVTAPPPKSPEVYFVNYADGESPTLPDGVDFETALNSAIEAEGQVIGGSVNVGVTAVGGSDANINSNFGGNNINNNGYDGNAAGSTSGAAVSNNNGFGANVGGSTFDAAVSNNNGFGANVGGSTFGAAVSNNNGYEGNAASSAFGGAVSNNNAFRGNVAGSGIGATVSNNNNNNNNNNGYNSAGGSASLAATSGVSSPVNTFQASPSVGGSASFAGTSGGNFPVNTFQSSPSAGVAPLQALYSAP